MSDSADRIKLKPAEAVAAATRMEAEATLIETALNNYRTEVTNNYQAWWDGAAFRAYQERSARRDDIHRTELVECLREQARHIRDLAREKQEFDDRMAAVMASSTTGGR
jgi:uncharacterized protein YukE